MTTTPLRAAQGPPRSAGARAQLACSKQQRSSHHCPPLAQQLWGTRWQGQVPTPGRRGRASRPPSLASPNASADAPSASGAAPEAASEPPPAPAPAAPSSKDAILARIARAKKYGSSGGGAGGGDAATEGPGPAAPAVAGPRVAALPQVGPTKYDWSAMVGFLDDPVTAERAAAGGGAAQPPSSYGGTAPVAAVDEAAEAAARAERERRFMADADSKDYMAILANSPRAAGYGSATTAASSLAAVLAEAADEGVASMRMEEITAAKEARLRAMGGEVITRDVSYNPGGNVSVRVSMPGAGMMAGPEAAAAAEAAVVGARRALEEAAAAKAAEEEAAWVAAEAQARAAAEAAEAAEAEAVAEGGDAYKPKVSTWGMFPRPQNISQAYGGGRDLKPGQELETPQQRAERERSYAAALASYKTKAGLDIDPEAEERAAKLYEEGMVLFNKGQLKEAYDLFDRATAEVPTKTRYGGLATLHKAIVLDSVGQGDKAQKLYKSIASHSVAQVAKKAKQMLFGFEAMAFLKADTINYNVKRTDYDKYFRMPADRRTLYVATEEDRQRDEANARVASVVALAVVLGPVVAVAALSLR